MRSVRARAAGLVGLEDLLHQRELARRVAVGLGDAARADSALRPPARAARGYCLQVALVGLAPRAARESGLLVQLGRLPQRVARELRVLVRGGQALELAGGLRPLALLEVGDARACRRPRPAADGSGSAGGSPRACASRRPSPSARSARPRRRTARWRARVDCGATVGDAGEVADRVARLAGARAPARPACRSTPPGARPGRCAPASFSRRQREHLARSACSARSKAPRLERGVREHRPGDAALRRRGRRLQASTCCATVARAARRRSARRACRRRWSAPAPARGSAGNACGEAQRAGDARCAAAPAARRAGAALFLLRVARAARHSPRRRSSRAPGSRRRSSRTRRRPRRSARPRTAARRAGSCSAPRRGRSGTTRGTRGTSAPPPGSRRWPWSSARCAW